MAISYTKSHFGKSLDESISAQDLIHYFSEEREESLTLEFKSYYANEKLNIDGVVRTVAAFLNSEGGLLIFGAPPDIRSTLDKYRVVKGFPTPIPRGIITKDKLINQFSDHISYLPIGIRVEPIHMPEGGFVYLIEVQESANKPHQHKIKTNYPIRLDGQSMGAPHYIVEALFKQIKTPQLNGLLVHQFVGQSNERGERTLYIELDIHLINETKLIPEYDVFYLIDVAHAQFVDSFTLTLSKGDNPVFREQVVKMLPYGVNIQRKERFKIALDQLNPKRFPHDPNYYECQMVIGFLFGGRSSSVKKTYEIKINYQVSEINRSLTHYKVVSTTELNTLDF